MIEKAEMGPDSFFISEAGLIPNEVSLFPIGEVLGVAFVKGKGGIVWIRHRHKAVHAMSLACLVTGGPYELIATAETTDPVHVGSFTAGDFAQAKAYHVFMWKPKNMLALNS